jgi:hypothetical protein
MRCVCMRARNPKKRAGSNVCALAKPSGLESEIKKKNELSREYPRHLVEFIA